MRWILLAVVGAACGSPPRTSEPHRASLDPPPPAGVLVPRGAIALHVEATPPRWDATFEPDRASPLLTGDDLVQAVVDLYRRDLEAAHVTVETFPWQTKALDYTVGSGDARRDVFVRPEGDGTTFSIAVTVPGG